MKRNFDIYKKNDIFESFIIEKFKMLISKINISQLSFFISISLNGIYFVVQNQDNKFADIYKSLCSSNSTIMHRDSRLFFQPYTHLSLTSFTKVLRR